MVANKFRISNLTEDEAISLCSDYLLVEHGDVSYKTTLKDITLSTEFDELRTKEIFVNGKALKNFTFRGKGILSSDQITMYDVTEKKNYKATGHAGWVYQVDIEQGDRIYASNGKTWYDCGFIQMNNASYTEYGLVKIGNGLCVDNGVLCANYQEFPTYDDFRGQNCDVAYTTPQGLVKQSILNENIYVCETDEEVEQAMNSDFSFENVFNTWQKTGVYSSNGEFRWYGYNEYLYTTEGDTPAGYPYWYYDSNAQTIVQPKNCNDYSMYISPNNYTNYDITTRFYSTNSDDDFIAMVGAFAIGSDGKPRCLSFSRTCQWRDTHPDVKYYRWVVSSRPITGGAIMSLSSKICSDIEYLDGAYVTNDQYTAAAYGWRTCGGGTLVRMRREGDMISAWTTPFLSSGNSASNINDMSSNMSAMLTVDLNQVNGGLFCVRNGGGKIGFSTHSQMSAMYQNLNFQVEKSIVDTRSNSLSTYNPITKTWSLVSTGFNTLSACGFGRIMKNDLTQKSFYVGQNNFSRLVDNYEEQFNTINSKIDAQLTKLNSIV